MKKITKTPVKTAHNDMMLSLPVTAHIELTSSCCFNCRHCYNFWRKDKDKKHIFMTQSQLDLILDKLINGGVLHFIFTGGEPQLNSKLLLRGIHKVLESGATVTCNSSLAVSNSLEELKTLKDAGLGHILTSLNSHIPSVNDYLVSMPGAYERIIKGIRNAVSSGMRISVNMIVSESNMSHIYETGKLAHNMGAGKFFGTRVVSNLSFGINEQKEFRVTRKEAQYILNELLRVKKDFGIQVGSLVPFPFCFMGFESWDDYKGFYSHGCPAGNKMISVNADGDVHACVHESRAYGNILKEDLKDIWKNMIEWRDGRNFPEECKACPVFDDCNAGCRLSALSYNNDIKSSDNLRIGWGDRKIKDNNPDTIFGEDFKYMIRKDILFRRENGFYILKRFGSEILCVKNDIAEKLMACQKPGTDFFLSDLSFDREAVKDLLREGIIIKS